MFSTVILIGAGVILLSMRMADAGTINRRKILSYEENKRRLKEHNPTMPIPRVYSVMSMQLDHADYDPEFVVLSRCDYDSEYCKTQGKSLRESRIQNVTVSFKDKQRNGAPVNITFVNHTQCACKMVPPAPTHPDCAAQMSRQKQLWHSVMEGTPTTKVIPSSRSTEPTPGTLQLISVEVHPSKSTNSREFGAETSSANIRNPRSRLITTMIVFLISSYKCL